MYLVCDGKKVQAAPQDGALSPKFSCSIYSPECHISTESQHPTGCSASPPKMTLPPFQSPYHCYYTPLGLSSPSICCWAEYYEQGSFHKVYISIISPRISRSPLLCSLPSMFQRVGVLCICITVLGWIVSSPVEVGSTKKLLFCKLHFQSPESAPDVEFCLQISRDFSWKASYCGKELQHECIILEDTPGSPAHYW